ncbi:MAG TPA: choice-of-anchor N protein [Candidatus Saccharimonadaceae bacterium]|jgi:hypothetical protein|nr:choice-of-anchor N protein [Candidatus Saccharimonadaceae bacterium]
MRRLFLGLAVIAGMSLAASAQAIPALQLYIAGSTYNAATETWEINSNSFDLWVLGDVDKTGGIFNVNLAASFYGTGSMSITPVSGPLVDKGSDQTQFAGTGFDQGVSTHEEFANADSHNFWGIGDFTGTGDQIGDYTGGLPLTFPDKGQINVYHVDITGYDLVHFDAFDHYVSGDHIQYTKAPFSHDASGGGTNPVPEPGTMALMGTGLIGIAVSRLRRRSS